MLKQALEDPEPNLNRMRTAAELIGTLRAKRFKPANNYCDTAKGTGAYNQPPE